MQPTNVVAAASQLILGRYVVTAGDNAGVAQGYGRGSFGVLAPDQLLDNGFQIEFIQTSNIVSFEEFSITLSTSPPVDAFRLATITGTFDTGFTTIIAEVSKAAFAPGVNAVWTWNTIIDQMIIANDYDVVFYA